MLGPKGQDCLKAVPERRAGLPRYPHHEIQVQVGYSGLPDQPGTALRIPECVDASEHFQLFVICGLDAEAHAVDRFGDESEIGRIHGSRIDFHGDLRFRVNFKMVPDGVHDLFQHARGHERRSPPAQIDASHAVSGCGFGIPTDLPDHGYGINPLQLLIGGERQEITIRAFSDTERKMQIQTDFFHVLPSCYGS